MPNENPEGGLRNHRTEFVRESTYGSWPSDPDFLKYSSTVTNFTWASDSVNEDRRGLGSADPHEFLKGPETHEITVEYDLVKWFTDGSGNANDAGYDGLARDSDQLLPNSHTIVDREDKGAIDSDQTVSGNASYATRLYTVATGALVDEIAVAGDPSDSQPVTVEITYLAQKARSYQIDQPDSGTLLAFDSTDANDTSQSVTVEDDDGNSETIGLDGTNLVSTSNQYSSIDAVELDAECDGDVTVYVNTGDATSPSAGDSLAVIYGSSSYNGVEGDLGVPAVEAGSHETLNDPAAEVFIGDTIDQAGSPFPYEIPAATLTVENNIEETERSSGYGMALHPGNREIMMEATMFGESMTHDMLQQHLANEANNISWNLDGGTLQLDSAVLDEPGERAAEEGQAVMTTDNTFVGSGLTFA